MEKYISLLIEQFKDLNPERTETIENKQKYILNNWKERQTYLNNKYLFRTLIYFPFFIFFS